MLIYVNKIWLLGEVSFLLSSFFYVFSSFHILICEVLGYISGMLLMSSEEWFLLFSRTCVVFVKLFLVKNIQLFTTLQSCILMFYSFLDTLHCPIYNQGSNEL